MSSNHTVYGSSCKSSISAFSLIIIISSGRGAYKQTNKQTDRKTDFSLAGSALAEKNLSRSLDVVAAAFFVYLQQKRQGASGWVSEGGKQKENETNEWKMRWSKLHLSSCQQSFSSSSLALTYILDELPLWKWDYCVRTKRGLIGLWKKTEERRK